MVPEPLEPVIWMRPEQAAVGRPATRSRAEITAAALGLADREGLAAVSMRRVAAELGTGAASLYRYVGNRDDLLDLMADATGSEYQLGSDPQDGDPPEGDWLDGLVAVGLQARAIMRRHPWLAGLIATRPVLGPNGVALLEHVLGLLDGHPAPLAAKLEAFAMLSGVTAAFVQLELASGPRAQERNATYLAHVLAAGQHPRLAALLASAPPAAGDPGDRFPDVLRRILSGLLTSPPARPD